MQHTHAHTQHVWAHMYTMYVLREGRGGEGRGKVGGWG